MLADQATTPLGREVERESGIWWLQDRPSIRATARERVGQKVRIPPLGHTRITGSVRFPPTAARALSRIDSASQRKFSTRVSSAGLGVRRLRYDKE